MKMGSWPCDWRKGIPGRTEDPEEGESLARLRTGKRLVWLYRMRKGKNMRLRRLAEAGLCIVLWAIVKTLSMLESNGSY